MQKINHGLTNTGLLDELKLLTLTHGNTQMTSASNVKFYQKSVKRFKRYMSKYIQASKLHVP
jgi:hypothetical protein